MSLNCEMFTAPNLFPSNLEPAIFQTVVYHASNIFFTKLIFSSFCVFDMLTTLKLRYLIIYLFSMFYV